VIYSVCGFRYIIRNSYLCVVLLALSLESVSSLFHPNNRENSAENRKIALVFRKALQIRHFLCQLCDHLPHLRSGFRIESGRPANEQIQHGSSRSATMSGCLAESLLAAKVMLGELRDALSLDTNLSQLAGGRNRAPAKVETGLAAGRT